MNDECLLIKQSKIRQTRIIRVLLVMVITNIDEINCKRFSKMQGMPNFWVHDALHWPSLRERQWLNLLRKAPVYGVISRQPIKKLRFFCSDLCAGIMHLLTK